MGFDLSEFYEIYGHDLEVEARQEQQRFQQRLLGWVQTWNNTLCSLYDTAVNHVRALAPEDWPLADLVPQVVLYWSLAGAQEGNQWNRTLTCGDGERWSQAIQQPYPPLLYTLMAHRAFPATLTPLPSRLSRGSAPFLPGRRPSQRGLWNLLAEAGPHLPLTALTKCGPSPRDLAPHPNTVLRHLFRTGYDSHLRGCSRDVPGPVEHPLPPSARPSASGGCHSPLGLFSSRKRPRDLLIAAYPEVFQTWDKETLENTWEAEILQRIYPTDPDLAIAMWRLLLDTAQEPLQKNPEAAEYLLFDVIDGVLWPGSPSRKDHLLPC